VSATKQRSRRKQRVSKSGYAPPSNSRNARARFRWRNRWLRGAVWLFLIVFVASVVGVAVVLVRH